jgi:hypothetical protein
MLQFIQHLSAKSEIIELNDCLIDEDQFKN